MEHFTRPAGEVTPRCAPRSPAIDSDGPQRYEAHMKKMFQWLFEQRDSVKTESLLHQQHLARTLDHAIKPTLIVSGKAGVFARQNAAIVGGELLEQDDILVVHGVDGEIDLGLRAGCALFNAAAAFSIPFVCVGFAGHKIYLISR